jgi:hypothetical protein
MRPHYKLRIRCGKFATENRASSRRNCVSSRAAQTARDLTIGRQLLAPKTPRQSFHVVGRKLIDTATVGFPAICAARDDRQKRGDKISMLHVFGGVAKRARAAIHRNEF